MSSEGALASPTGAAAHEGFLSKRSEWLGVWRRRYFKLYMGAGGPRLYYMKDQDSPPHGVIDLRTCLTVKTADEKTGKSNSFEVATGEQVFFMFADSAQIKDEVRLAFGGALAGGAQASTHLTSHAHKPWSLAVGGGAGTRHCLGRQVRSGLGSRGGGGGL